MRQVTNDQLYICFDCGTPEFHYFEFEDHNGYENPDCPQCSRENTLPKFYLEDMSIPMLQKLFSEMAEATDLLPILDYTFKDFKIPAIVCHYKISENAAG